MSSERRWFTSNDNPDRSKAARMIINDMVLGNLIWAELPPSTSVDFDTSHDAEMFNNNENDINQIKDAQSDSNLINDQSTIDLGSNVNCNDENYKR